MSATAQTSPEIDTLVETLRSLCSNYDPAFPEKSVRSKTGPQTLAKRSQELRLVAEKLRGCLHEISDGLNYGVCLHTLLLLVRDSSDVSQSELASRVLKMLLPIVGAESIAFVGQASTSDDHAINPKVECSEGEPVSTQVYQELLGVWGQWRDDPVLTHRSQGDPPAVWSAIVAPASYRSTNLGWLMALTREPEDASHESARFGRIEAGIVEAAAIHIAAHARDSELAQRQDVLLNGIVSLLNS